MDNLLKKDYEERMSRLGFKPVPKEDVDAWCEYVEKFVIPRITQRMYDRTPPIIYFKLFG